ncbi:MAG: DUF58 domain-containing protein [Gemmatimonadetes bacterium]|nr:DUF58 domain-containing protein [Gemmatimonadota bacterium]
MTDPGPASGGIARVRSAMQALHSWRRLRFTMPGLLFVAGALAIGFAAINTGNNLLYLLLGAMLGATAVSGWISEQTIRNVEIVRRVPRGVPVGQEARLHYLVRNRKRKMPVLGLELRETGLPGVAFIAELGPGEVTETDAVNTFVQRGVYPLRTLTLSTTFPFGFFRKERDMRIEGELVIWPRSDRPVPPPRPGAGRRSAAGSIAARGQGPRGEFRGLRDYRSGDDARDIHWRSTARRGEPVVREYDPDASDTLWICLDVATDPGESAEEAVEIAASLAARASAGGRRHGLAAGDIVVPPASGRAQFERVLEALARVDFSRDASPPAPPVDRASCVLVGTARVPGDWTDVRLAEGVRRVES